MGKFTKLLGLALLSATAAQAQLVENFDDPSVTAPSANATVWELPSGTWQIFDNGVGTVNWTLNVHATYPANSGTNAAFINRQNIGQGSNSLDFLASPAIPMITNPQVRFFTRTTSAQDTGTLFHLKAAPSGADPADPASYTINLGTWNEEQLSPEFDVYNEIVVDIPAEQQALLGASFHIAFVKDYTQTGSAISGERWLVDDVRVISNCVAPQDVTLTALHNVLNINWDAGAAQTVWAHIVPAGTDFNPATTTAQPIAFTGVGPYQITQTTFPTVENIIPVTDYEVYLLTECEFSEGEWTTAYEITTNSAPPVCGGNYVDNGGVTGNYLPNSDEIVTICPENPGDIVVVSFSSFSVENNYDGLFVYNGNSINAPQISSTNGAGQIGTPGAFWGNTTPGPFESQPDGCLTFRFVSDGFVNQAGFVATIECLPAPTCIKPTALTVLSTFDTRANISWTEVPGAVSYEIVALPCGTIPTFDQPGMFTTTATTFEVTGLIQLTCYDFYVRAVCGPDDLSFWSIKATTTTQQTPPQCGDMFTDNGGVDGPYLGNSNSTITICPDQPGEVVRVTFTSFNTEAMYDGIYVYDGNSINAPMIPSTNLAGWGSLTTAGAYWGLAIPGPFESSSPDGCLTFHFLSDGWTSYDGWTANIECVPFPTCPRVTGITTSDITTNTLNLSWTAGGTETQWVVYALPCSSAAPTFGQEGGIEVFGTPELALADLTPASCYRIYIFAVCGEDDYSSVQGPVTINTLIAPPVCGGNLVDPGGLTANYPNSMNEIITICPEEGEFVTVEFTYLQTENNWDGFYVFDGDSVNAPQISSGNPAGNGGLNTPGAYWGSTLPLPFEATGSTGCLTFRFVSDSSVNMGGWVANIICAPFPTCPKPTNLQLADVTHQHASLTWTPVGEETQWMVFALPCGTPKPNSTTAGGVIVTDTTHTFEDLDAITCYDFYVIPLCSDDDHGPTAGPITTTTTVAPPVCGGIFIDEGGLGNYSPNSDYTITVCPETPGDLVSIFFTEFNVESTYDGLFVFDGDSVNAPMISSGNVPGWGNLEPGAFWGTTIPGPFFATSESGCLTFRFVSDAWSNYSGWLADVVCSPAPNCSVPEDLHLVSATELGMEFGWTENDPTVTQWEIIVLPAGSPHPHDATTGWQVATTNPYFYEMDMIQANYQVYVRGICPDGGTSNWSTSIEVNPFVVVGDMTTYTVEELVTDVLLKSSCAIVENITFNSQTAIGYFESNLAEFPFSDGVVLTTGRVDQIKGPNTSTLGFDNDLPGDADLEAIILAATGEAMDSGNAAILEFDFTPISPNFKFRFAFASEEYGQYQCDYSDAFAFILTDVTAGTPPVNLAVVPSTTDPISVVTVHNALHYDGWAVNCGDANVDYFETFWGDTGEDPNTAPINFNGITVPFQIDHIVIPGNVYHIKLVIADRLDTSFDSAVFIEGNSLDIGSIELGEDFVAADGTAFCEGDSYELQTGLPAADYSFVWTKDGEVLAGETGSSYLVEGPGVYGVTASFLISTCTTSDSVTIEFFENMDLTGIEDLTACDPSGFATFDLNTIMDQLPGIVGGDDIFASLHTSLEDANTGGNPILDLANFQNQQTGVSSVYIRVENLDTGCIAIEEIQIIVSAQGPSFDVAETLTFCETTTGVITVNFIDTAIHTMEWYFNGDLIAGETGHSLTVSQAGTYTVREYAGVCYTERSIEVTVIEAPETITDVVACDQYILPAIVGAGTYYTQANGQGNTLAAGAVITSTQTIYVYNEGCEEVVFTVTINVSPTISIEGACINNVFTLNAITSANFAGEIVWTNCTDASVVLGTGSTFVPTQQGTYCATIIGDCEVTSVPLEVTTIQCQIQKGISADGDGLNDSFDLAGYSVSKLSIYNRYGMKVYDMGNYSSEFTGIDNDGNELPVGTYYYVIELSNGAPTITGWLYIAR